jgi:hypothetical protein
MKRRFLELSALLIVMAVAVSCGNPRPPEPPALELPNPVKDLRAARKGDKVYLSWSVPTKTTEAQTIRYIGPTRICRARNAAVAGCATPAGEAPAPDLSRLLTAVQNGKSETAAFVDTLPATELSPGAEFTYAVDVLNDRERSAGLSNQVSVPGAPALPPPAGFQARLTADGVLLSWNQIHANADIPELEHRYRIYRNEIKGPEMVIAELPLGTSQFLDHNFEWEKTYQYRADVVTIVAPQSANCIPDQFPSTLACRAASIEGEDSSVVEIFAHDIFPPGVPSGLQAVSSEAGNQKFIDLIWTPDSAPDLAGYNVFRHEEGAEGTQINTEPVKTPAYRDVNVKSGKKYFYSVSAVDVRGNQSARSEEASEVVP